MTSIQDGESLSWSVSSSVCLLDLDRSHFLRLGTYYSMILLKIVSVPLTLVSTPSSIPIFHRFSIFKVSQCSCTLPPWVILDMTFFLTERFKSYTLSLRPDILYFMCSNLFMSLSFEIFLIELLTFCIS